MLVVRPDRDCVWAQYTVMVDNRPAVQKALQAAGVPTAVHYPKPLHHQPAYAAGQDATACPHSIRAAQRVLSLPMTTPCSPCYRVFNMSYLIWAVSCVFLTLF